MSAVKAIDMLKRNPLRVHRGKERIAEVSMDDNDTFELRVRLYCGKERIAEVSMDDNDTFELRVWQADVVKIRCALTENDLRAAVAELESSLGLLEAVFCAY